MTGRGDPFDFNDIYNKLGADGLVHKPMKAQEVKKPTHNYTGMLGAGSQRTSGSGMSPSLGTVPGAGASIQPNASENNPMAGMSNSLMLDDLFSSPKPKAEASSLPVDDPFAAFGAVDGAMPVVAAAHESLSSQSPGSSSDNLLGPLDDHLPTGVAAPSRQLSSSKLADPPRSLSPAPTFQPPAPPPLVSSSTAPSLAPIRSSSPVPSNGLSSHVSEPEARARQRSALPAAAPHPTPTNSHLTSTSMRSSNDGQQPHDERHNPDWGYENYRRQDEDEWSSSSSAVVPHSAPAPPMSVLGGFFKKAVKAAQTGLQHLESAIEKGFEHPAATRSSQQHQMPMSSSEEGWRANADKGRNSRYSRQEEGGRASVAPSGARRPSYANHSAGEDSGKALEVALRIMELPMEIPVDIPPPFISLTCLHLAQVRSDALCGLQPGLRERVEILLREQAMLNEENSNNDSSYGGYDQVIHTHEFDPLGELPPPWQQPLVTGSAAPAASTNLSGSFPDDGHPISASSGLVGVSVSASSQQPLERSVDGSSDSGGPSRQQQTAGPQTTPVADLIGGFEGEVFASAANPAPAASNHTMDLMGGFEDSGFPESSVAAAATHAAAASPLPTTSVQPASSNDFGDDFFSGGSQPAVNVPSIPSPAPAPTSSSHKPQSNPRPALDLIGDLHGLGEVDVGNNHHLYQADEEGEEGEPELRKQLRAARLAEKHNKMKAALAEKLANDENEARRREEQVQIKDHYKEAINLWKNKNKGNIRGMLGSLQTVLWEGSGWVPVGVGDMLEGNQVKRVYMKANLLVHPDKVRQRNGTPEQVAIADMVFDVLKEAWGLFKP